MYNLIELHPKFISRSIYAVLYIALNEGEFSVHSFLGLAVEEGPHIEAYVEHYVRV